MLELLKMGKKTAKERIEQLKKAINYHRYLYHVLDKQEISDSALDSLKKELFDLEQQYPDLITPDSPTQRVGGKPLKEFEKVRHEKPMLSFNDAFSEQDIKDWLKRLENYLGKKIIQYQEVRPPNIKHQYGEVEPPKINLFYCELKLDGLAIELVYENGVLIQGSTRGDGLIGEDVTQNLKTIEAIPLNIRKFEIRNSKFEIPLKFVLGGQTSKNLPKKLIVRGEIFITKKDFEQINKAQIKNGLKPFANPRNVAAGSIRQLDPKITASRRLDSYIYDIALPSEALAKEGVQTHEEKHQILKSLGFKTNPHNKSANNLKEVFAFRNHWEKKENRDKLPYEIDGVVVIVNDNKIFENGGIIGKASRAAIAHKFSPKEAETIVEDIKIQVGRTGVLTPVATLRPVQVGGTTISHSTLHNFDEIQRLDVKIGDTVIVSRAGDVIPKVTKVLKEMRTGKEKEFQIPKNCPVDGAKVIKEGAVYHCSNPKCGARHQQFLKHFVSRSAFDIQGLGPKILNRFLDESLISDAADIFQLKEGDIAVLERFGKKSAQNIVNEAELRKTIALPRFINALGIFHIGEETAILLAQKFYQYYEVRSPQINRQYSEIEPPKIKDLIKFYKNLSLEELQQISSFGPKIAQSIYDWFHNEKNIKFLEKLEKAGVRIETPKLETKNLKLKTKNFVLTGTLESMSREQAKEKIRELGGEISESVSKSTDYVVVGSEPGSKSEKAKKLGVKIIDEKEFLKMLK